MSYMPYNMGNWEILLTKKYVAILKNSLKNRSLVSQSVGEVLCNGTLLPRWVTIGFGLPTSAFYPFSMVQD